MKKPFRACFIKTKKRDVVQEWKKKRAQQDLNNNEKPFRVTHTVLVWFPFQTEVKKNKIEKQTKREYKEKYFGKKKKKKKKQVRRITLVTL